MGVNVANKPVQIKSIRAKCAPTNLFNTTVLYSAQYDDKMCTQYWAQHAQCSQYVLYCDQLLVSVKCLPSELKVITKCALLSSKCSNCVHCWAQSVHIVCTVELKVFTMCALLRSKCSQFEHRWAQSAHNLSTVELSAHNLSTVELKVLTMCALLSSKCPQCAQSAHNSYDVTKRIFHVVQKHSKFS